MDVRLGGSRLVPELVPQRVAAVERAAIVETALPDGRLRQPGRRNAATVNLTLDRPPIEFGDRLRIARSRRCVVLVAAVFIAGLEVRSLVLGIEARRPTEQRRAVCQFHFGGNLRSSRDAQITVDRLPDAVTLQQQPRAGRCAGGLLVVDQHAVDEVLHAARLHADRDAIEVSAAFHRIGFVQ